MPGCVAQAWSDMAHLVFCMSQVTGILLVSIACWAVSQQAGFQDHELLRC